MRLKLRISLNIDCVIAPNSQHLSLSRSEHMFGQTSNLCRDDLLLLLITVLRTSLRNVFIHQGQEMKKGVSHRDQYLITVPVFQVAEASDNAADVCVKESLTKL